MPTNTKQAAAATPPTDAIPLFALEFVGLVVLLVVLNWLLKRWQADNPERGTFRMGIVAFVGVLGFVVILSQLPDARTSVEHMVTLLGILLSAAIALSSTTFISNFMAGIMLKRITPFRPGDFLKAGEHIGRVSDIGMLHTEIQTEDSDLTTLPNLFLVTNPCKVVRRDKTIVSSTVSLGYDVPHGEVKSLLCQAATDVPLKDAFVQILDLGDYAVTYRVAGVLENVRKLLSTRSKLRENMLDALHGAGIEIVSPSFMYTRTQSAREQMLSEVQDSIETKHREPNPESVIFDKADEAELVDDLRVRHESLLEQINTLKEKIKESESDADIEQLKREIKWRETSAERLQQKVEAEDDAAKKS
jgi:small-conductance mechanosensitive channel